MGSALKWSDGAELIKGTIYYVGSIKMNHLRVDEALGLTTARGKSLPPL